jgi:hypothetical protein
VRSDTKIYLRSKIAGEDPPAWNKSYFHWQRPDLEDDEEEYIPSEYYLNGDRYRIRRENLQVNNSAQGVNELNFYRKSMRN